VLDVIDLAFAGAPDQDPKDRPAYLLRVYSDIVLKGFPDVIEEILFVTLFMGLSPERPALIIETPNEHGELRSELDSLLNR